MFSDLKRRFSCRSENKSSNIGAVRALFLRVWEGEWGWGMMFVMLLWVYIHTGQAWKICPATMGIEPTTFGSFGSNLRPLVRSKGRIGSIPTVGQAYFSSLPGADIHSE
jgi:hypothetical protein